MVVYEASSRAEVSQERVWQVLAAVESWPAWLPTVQRVEPLDGLPIALGKRFRIHQPKLKATIWTVCELAPPARFAWRASSFGVSYFADHVLERLDERATHIRLRFEIHGWLARPLAAAYGQLVRAYLEQEAQALQRTAEGCLS
jgi:hypothetical protein